MNDTIEEKVHRNFKTGIRNNFKDNRRPAVVTNNFPQRQHELVPEKGRAAM